MRQDACMDNGCSYLDPSNQVDSNHPDIVALARSLTDGATSPADQAVRLHDFVRDQVPFGWAPAFDRQRASEVLASRIGFCNTKSTLLVALLRAAAIPARIQAPRSTVAAKRGG
jgi:transglutaminase-like putative cysteine protease